MQLTSARQRLNPALASRLFQGVDGLVLATVFVSGGWDAGLPGIAAGLALAVLIDLLLGVAGAYGLCRNERLWLHLLRLEGALASSLACARLLLVGRGSAVGPIIDAEHLAAAFLALTSMHLIWWGWARRWRAKGLLTPNIVIVGATDAARALIGDLIGGRAAGEANVIGIFDDRAARRPRDIMGVPVLGSVKSLLTHHTLAAVDRIVITVPAGAAQRVAQLVDSLQVLPHEIMLVVDKQDDRAVDRLGATPLASLGGRRMNAGRAAAKRAQDLLLAGSVLLLAAPLMAAVALAVSLDSPGPIFFRQKRHGFNNEEFYVWKFRSMRADAADATASRQVTTDDDRVTRVGRFIRKTSLDELPQLFNVLRGEMSLVGPRPHAIGMKSGGADAASLVRVYSHRHRLKPGLTGWAAIKGSRGPVDDLESLQRRLMLDLNYIEHQSFWLDLWILIATLPLVLGDREGVR